MSQQIRVALVNDGPTPFTTYVNELKSKLDGKSLNTDPTRWARGDVILIFPGAKGYEPGRITVRMYDTVTVTETTSMSESRHVVVRAPFRSWLAYCSDPSNTNLAALELYGDLGLFSTLAAVMRAKRGAISMRVLGASSVPTSQRHKPKTNIPLRRN